MNERISVIVPIYKVEKYLRKCVDSIIGQTHQNLEIILVDDGSPDDCGAICDAYAAKDSRIKVIHKQNGGLSDARNAGLDIMTGEYVGFVDSDDWIEPEMYEKLLKNMKYFNADISFGGVSDDLERDGVVKSVKVSDYGEKTFAESKTDAIKRYFLGSWAAWDKLYKASLFDNIRYPKGEINEDEAIVLHLLEQCRKVCYTSEIFYHYMRRQNSGSITMSGFSRKKLAWYNHCKSNLGFVSERYPELLPYAKHRYFSSLIWTLNSMTTDTKQFSDLIPQLRKELILGMKTSDWSDMLAAKEKIRAYLLAYCYYPYAMIIHLLGKQYA